MAQHLIKKKCHMRSREKVRDSMSSGVEWSNPHVYSTWQRSEIIELADFSQGFWTKTKREPAQRERSSVRSNSRNTQAPRKNVDKRCASSPAKSRATGSRTAKRRRIENRGWIEVGRVRIQGKSIADRNDRPPQDVKHR